MRVALMDDDGTVIDSWDIEEEFGDVSKAIAASYMNMVIRTAILNQMRKEPE